MPNTFYTWDAFVNNFGSEMREAVEQFENMTNHGCPDLAVATFDFTFESDEEDKLVSLSKYLQDHYEYSIESIENDDGVWELNGSGAEIPVTEDNVMYWILDMAKRGYEFDAKLTGYGATTPGSDGPFPDLDEKLEGDYFDRGLNAYNAGNRSAAIVNWSLVILINDRNVNAYYSRAIVKNELYSWKAALRDYDEAIRLAPNFLAALTNRGALKDDNGDDEGALADYNKVIAIAGDDKDQLAQAHFNRGNTHHRMGRHDDACRDWKKAFELGADYAAERIDTECRKR